ncbi:MAG: methyl-accepting chemotaxis protein [Desulfobacter sp.]
MNPRKKKPSAIKRRQLYINKEFQTRFIFKFCLILVLSGAISIGLTLLNTSDTLTTTYMNSKLVIQSTSLAILPSVIYTTLITTLVVGMVVIMVTLLVSHKIAGPMYRFEKDINRVAKGDLRSRIRIRKGDQFQELAVSLNHMIDSLSARVSDVKHEADALAGETHAAAGVKDKINDNFIL